MTLGLGSTVQWTSVDPVYRNDFEPTSTPVAPGGKRRTSWSLVPVPLEVHPVSTRRRGSDSSSDRDGTCPEPLIRRRKRSPSPMFLRDLQRRLLRRPRLGQNGLVGGRSVGRVAQVATAEVSHSPEPTNPPRLRIAAREGTPWVHISPDSRCLFFHTMSVRDEVLPGLSLQGPAGPPSPSSWTPVLKGNTKGTLNSNSAHSSTFRLNKNLLKPENLFPDGDQQTRTGTPLSMTHTFRLSTRPTPHLSPNPPNVNFPLDSRSSLGSHSVKDRGT